MPKTKEKIAYLVSIVTSRASVFIGVFEDYNEALQFAQEEDKIKIDSINFFPKKRIKKSKLNS